jgi:DNA-nicking Smr family endonuclease
MDEDPFPAPVVLEIGDVFDLHAIADADCHAATLEYLHEARRRGYVYLRLIHGKGRGVRRRMVRELLARTDFVLHFEDAPPAAGGTGATLVTLARTDSIGESS